MAVKAMDSVTVIDYTDVSNVKAWYLAIPRTSAAPTVAPNATEAQMRSNGWSTQEPGVDTTKKLYKVDECIFGDGTYVWGDVSLSSSYEAAIEAYNEAQAAKTTATNYIQTISNGVWVTPADKSPDINGNPISTTRGIRITDNIDIYRGIDSVASYGDRTRIGKDDAARIEIDPYSLSAYDNDSNRYYSVGNPSGTVQEFDYTYTSGSSTYWAKGYPGALFDVEVYVNDVQLIEDTEYTVDIEEILEIASEPANGSSNSDSDYYYTTITITKILTDGDEIHVSFLVDDSDAYFTFLNRKRNATIGSGSVSFGHDCAASGRYSYAEGNGTNAIGVASHSEGLNSTASGNMSHAEGSGTIAYGLSSHAEGYQTGSSTSYSHAEGYMSNAAGPAAHAEGWNTIAMGWYSHAEGRDTHALGDVSHASGVSTWAYGTGSFTSGTGTYVSSNGEAAFGKWNVKRNDGIFAIGNGVDDDHRSDCFAIHGSSGEILSSRIGNVLWTGAYYMTSGHTATFTNSQKVSEQLNGIVLVWSAYANSTAQNYDWTYYFVPKWHVAFHEGQSVDILMMNNTIASNVMCRKLVYVYDNRIVGNDNNTATGTGYANNSKVLRAVIGV